MNVIGYGEEKEKLISGHVVTDHHHVYIVYPTISCRNKSGIESRDRKLHF